MDENKELPKGWAAPVKEFCLGDMSGNSHTIKFKTASVTRTGATEGEPKFRLVEQCQTCNRLVNPQRDALILHAYRHIFLQIPFDADEGKF